MSWESIKGSLDRSAVNDKSHVDTSNTVLHFETKSSGMIEHCVVKTTDGRIIPVVADIKTRTVYPSRNKQS
jgi:hypothetical protein